MRWTVRASAAVAIAVGIGWSTTAGAASSGTVVTADIPSAIQLTNSCLAGPATEFGVVQPGTPATTATGAGICTVSWASSNNTSQLRLVQADGAGSAMGRVGSTTTSIDFDSSLAVSSADGTNAVAVGPGGKFGYSIDGGGSWSLVSTIGGNSSEIDDVAQVPGTPGTAWVVGWGPRLQRVRNALTAPSATSFLANLQAGGWPVGVSPLTVVATDPTTIFVGGESGWVAKSGNSGSIWTAYQLPSTSQVTSLNYLASTGVVWMTTSNAAGGNVRSVLATSGTTAGSWTQYNVAAGASVLTDIRMSNASTGVAVGVDGKIYAWNGSSFTWTANWNLMPGSIGSVSSPTGNPNTFIAVGEDGRMIRSVNGGSSWTAITFGVGTHLTSITEAAGTMIAVGLGQSTIRSTDGNAATWTFRSDTAGARSMADVAMAPVTGQVVVGVGSRGTIWRSTDGGQTWIDTWVANRSLNEAVMLTPDDLVVLASGRTYTSNDAGATWSWSNTAVGETEELAATDFNHVLVGFQWGGSQLTLADTSPNALVPDYGAAPNNWASTAQAMFGVCVQGLGASTTIGAGWTKDPDTCTASDGDPWKAVPTTASTVGTVGVAGNTGSVNLVWGVRFMSSQTKGLYSAGVTFEALAP